jgi:hypothetical protein
MIINILGSRRPAATGYRYQSIQDTEWDRTNG